MARAQLDADYSTMLDTLSGWLSKAKNDKQREVLSAMLRSITRMYLHDAEVNNRLYSAIAELETERKLHRQSLNRIVRMREFIRDQKLEQKFKNQTL